MIWDDVLLELRALRGPATAQGPCRPTPSSPRWIISRLSSRGLAFETIHAGLVGLGARREAVRLRVSPMSSGWMERRGYWLPASAGFRLKLRVWSIKRRVRKAARRG